MKRQAMRFEYLTPDENWQRRLPKTDTWWYRLRLGRLRVGLRVHCHRSHLSDRWVIQPELTYDRKEKQATTDAS